MENKKSSVRMRLGHYKHKQKDVFAELSQAGYEAEHVLALKQRMSNLWDRLEALEKQAREEKIKRNKFVLRELVKAARSKILEVSHHSLHWHCYFLFAKLSSPVKNSGTKFRIHFLRSPY